MTTPLAPSLAEWVEQAIFAARDVYAAKGIPFDREATLRAFEQGLASRWNPADECDDPDPEDMPNVPGYLQGRDL